MVNIKIGQCTEEMMSLTKDGKALYLHCLPADITGVSCEERRSRRNSIRSLSRTSFIKESKLQTICYCSYDLLKQFKNPVETLKELERKGN